MFETNGYEDFPYDVYWNRTGIGQGFLYDFEVEDASLSSWDIYYRMLPLSITASLFYVNPENGEYRDLTFSYNCEYDTVFYQVSTIRREMVTLVEYPRRFAFQDGKLGWLIDRRTYDDYNERWSEERIFKPIIDTPDVIKDWFDSYPYYTSSHLDWYDIYDPLKKVLPSLRLVNILPQSGEAAFGVIPSGTPFGFKSSAKSLTTLGSTYDGLQYAFDFPDTTHFYQTSDGTKLATRNLHVAICVGEEEGKCAVFVFRSELHPDVFDFDAEIQRSLTQ